MIRKIKWHNHAVLGNLELNLLKEDGTAYNTIVLAGENGTGKTTILETLATFLSRGSFAPFENIQYNVGNEVFTLSRSSDSDAISGFHIRTNEKTGKPEDIRYISHNNASKIDKDIYDIRHYGIAYSKAHSGFSVGPILSATAQQLESNKYEVDSDNDYTAIKQLLVDIDTEDCREWRNISETDNICREKYDEFKRGSKIFWFKKAFDGFFDAIKYNGIEPINDELKITFTKHGKTIEIDRLSTGEQQIVFRGAYLLKNSDYLSRGVILVDEPELSMHPKWQGKILNYYRDLFPVNDKQVAQMFFATHSEAVLNAALKDKDKGNILVIVLNDKDGKIVAKRITAPYVLPSITSAETNYLAFDIASKDYHIELYAHLQNKIGKASVKDSDDYITGRSAYNPNVHKKEDHYTDSKGKTTYYETLPTYIRNAIDHPNPGREFTDDELRRSIELLIELCK